MSDSVPVSDFCPKSRFLAIFRVFHGFEYRPLKEKP